MPIKKSRFGGSFFFWGGGGGSGTFIFMSADYRKENNPKTFKTSGGVR